MKKSFSLKSLILITFIGLNFGGAHAQELNALGRVNLGIGFDRLSQDFNGINTYYSPGGGIGLEAGLEGELPQNVFWYGMLGICMNVSFHYENLNGVENKTFYTWNKKMISAGANKFFDIKNKYVPEFFAGAGLTYYIPGQLKREETNKYKGAIDYNSTLGFQLETGLTLHLIKSLELRPSVRYRFAKFQSTDYSQGTIDQLDPALRKANASGIDLSVSIVHQLRAPRTR